MGLNSTRFVSYQDIRTDDTDLIDDAWGFYKDYPDVIALLNFLDTEVTHDLTGRLMDRIRKKI